MKRCPFYLFEGVDGSGKSTLAKLFAKKIGGIYYEGPAPEVLHLEPLANRSSPTVRYYYYLFSNAVSSDRIKKMLEKRPVVMDMFYYITIAHQSVLLGRDLPIPDLLKPDYIFYLHAPWKVIEERLSSRKGAQKRNEYEKLNHLKKVAKVYNKILPKRNVYRLDTSIEPPKATVRRIFNLINKSQKGKNSEAGR